MRKFLPFAGMLIAFALAAPGEAQITSNPLPEPIVKKGIAVEIRDIVRLPDTPRQAR